MALAEAPLGQHVKRGVIIRLGGIEDGIRHRHRRGGANQCNRSDAFAVRGRALERDQAAQAVTHQSGIGDIQYVQDGDHPAGHLFHRGQRASRRAPMTGQVH